MTTFDRVVGVLAESLDIQERASSLEPSTPLLGSMPEFDSIAVVRVVVMLEQHFGFEIDPEDLSAVHFESVGSLTKFVDEILTTDR